MGRRSRERARISAPDSEYRDAEGNLLVLRGKLSPGSRREYAEVLGGGLHREDARQRALELLFEKLAVSWTVSGVAASAPRQLLDRYRIASAAERDFVRDALRRHAAEHFPELETP